MGDGKHTKTGLTLCTDSYSILDVVRLMNVLIIRYDLICTIHNPKPEQYRIHISKKSMNKIKTIVTPYIITSMLYKIHL
jgi:LAGLIDADG DNA endonuclease family.